MTPGGTVRVLVRSRKVPVRTFLVSRPIYGPSGVQVGTEVSRKVVYSSSLDDSQKRAIKEAKKLSCNLGLDLEVVDSSRGNPFRRIVFAISGGGSTEPSLQLAASVDVAYR